MRVVILGAAAGGGFPQWNSNAPGCRRARAGDPAAKPRSQISLAVSADNAKEKIKKKIKKISPYIIKNFKKKK